MGSFEQRIRKLWQQNSLLNYFLLPLSILYYLCFLVKKFSSKERKVNAYVICIGNLTVGGSGKTPLALALAKKLISLNKKVAFVSRGYKGLLSSNSPLQVDNLKHTPKQVGDEPMLLSKVAPTYICKNRYYAAKRACDEGAKFIIMDDGLQHFSLKKDFIILTVDDYEFGNKMLIPAGPLREPIGRIKNINLIANYTSRRIGEKGIKEVKLSLKISNLSQLKKNSYLAFCGIGNPDKFHKLLLSNRISIGNFFTFSDHHIYESEEIENLIKIAKTNDLRLLTTTKDLIKIPEIYHGFIDVAEIEVTGADEIIPIILSS